MDGIGLGLGEELGDGVGEGLGDLVGDGDGLGEGDGHGLFGRGLHVGEGSAAVGVVGTDSWAVTTIIDANMAAEAKRVIRRGTDYSFNVCGMDA